jgi:hypothetical protein
MYKKFHSEVQSQRRLLLRLQSQRLYQQRRKLMPPRSSNRDEGFLEVEEHQSAIAEDGYNHDKE